MTKNIEIDKDIKIVSITIFHMSQKLEEITHTLHKSMENILKKDEN